MHILGIFLILVPFILIWLLLVCLTGLKDGSIVFVIGIIGTAIFISCMFCGICLLNT